MGAERIRYREDNIYEVKSRRSQASSIFSISQPTTTLPDVLFLVFMLLTHYLVNYCWISQDEFSWSHGCKHSLKITILFIDSVYYHWYFVLNIAIELFLVLQKFEYNE